MIKIFSLTQENDINNFLLKYPNNTVTVTNDNIVINYSDTKNECVPYRAIKFKPINIKIVGKDGSFLKERFTTIRFFDNCFMIGDKLRLFYYNVGTKDIDGDGARAYYLFNNNRKKEIEKIYLGDTIRTSWFSGDWECDCLGEYFHTMIENEITNPIECDENYKFDKRTKAVISIGENIREGIEYSGDKISNSISKGTKQIAGGLHRIANTNDNIAYATAYGRIPLE